MEVHDTQYHQVLSELAEPVRDVRSQIPDVWRAYADLHKAAMAEGELGGAVKELIALAIAVTRECDGCIASHSRSAARRGATPSQVAEMIGVAVLMLGGPGTVYGPRAWKAFMEFYQADHQGDSTAPVKSQ